MKQQIQRFMTFVYLGLEKLKGNRKFVPLPFGEDDELKVRAKSFFGYSVVIHVRRRVYNCIYERRWFGRSRFITYEVWSDVDKNAPDEIKKAWKKQYTFPKMLPAYVSSQHQMERAIAAYVDLILDEGIQDA